MFRRALTSIFLVAVTAIPAAGQTAVQNAPEAAQVIVTTGDGVVRKAPDRAWVVIAAESRARVPQEAQRANAEAMAAVTARIKAAGVPAESIQTIGYDLQPEYDYVNGKQTLRDYVARNQVQVKVDALAKLGDIIASAVGSGATNVSGIRFDLQDRDTVERDALRRAVADARARADAAAAGAGVRIERIVRIEEQRDLSVPQPRPYGVPMMAQRAEAAPAVPIESGEIEVRARVTLTAAIR